MTGIDDWIISGRDREDRQPRFYLKKKSYFLVEIKQKKCRGAFFLELEEGGLSISSWFRSAYYTTIKNK